MTKMRTSLTRLSLAFLLTACGSGDSSQGGSGGAGETGGSGGSAATGGAGGNTNDGSGGTQSGGSGGGSGGSQSGGAAGSQSGGAGGGAGGDQNGGAGGSTSGGGGGGPNGGAGGGANGGTASGGSAAGGTVGKGGASGGATTGGSQAGGNPGSGGATTPGTGGTTPVAEPKLVTSSEGAYWRTNSTWTEVTSGTADVTVNDASAQQTWAGFGGTFNEAGWDALSVLSATDRDVAMKMLFDAAQGANFVYGRVPIGASDYAMDRYSLNENANDYAMDKFSIERDRQKLIPFIKAALAIKPGLHLWASPWTPPTWMKTGTYTADGKTGWDGGNMKDDAQILKAHAIYLAKFVEEYGKEDIKIEAVHPQNEPGYATRYPSCLWTAALMNKFIGTYLGPTFAERNVTAQIYLGTMSNNESGKDGTIVSTVLGDATAMKYVKGCGLQWNMIDSTPTCAGKSLQVVQSEHKCGNYPWNPSGFPAFNPDKPPNDYAYGVESWGWIRDWINKGVHVYSAWNMVLDTAGKNLDTTRPWPQNTLLVVDRGSKTFSATAAYYVFRHTSQFVDPGAKRVATSGGDALAFKNPDGTLVAIVHNTATSSKNMIVKIGGKLLQFSVPAKGFATVNPQ